MSKGVLPDLEQAHYQCRAGQGWVRSDDVANILRDGRAKTCVASTPDTRSRAVCKLGDGVDDLLLLLPLLLFLFPLRSFGRQLDVRRGSLWRLGERRR